MKVLESFLIALGIKVDDKSFQKADAAFAGLTKSALQLGGVLASKLAIDKVVGDFKNAGTELNNFNKLTGISTQRVQTLGQAYTAMGGNVSDAFSDLTKLQDLMASPITGNVGWMGEAARFGLDPDVIIGAENTAEAMINITKAFEIMAPLNQRLAANAIGLSETGARFAMSGEAAARKQLNVTGKLAVMTDKQIEDAARLTKASSELDLVFTDMGNTIAGELAPAFAELAEDFAKFYRNNKELVDSELKEFFGDLADNIELVAIAMALMGGGAALKGLAALRAILGLGGGNPPPAPGSGPTPLPLVARLGVPLTALLYSSSLGEGEDDDLLNNKLKKGGPEAFDATVKYLSKNGIPHHAAVGLAAGIEEESGFNAKAVGDHGNAVGLAQWQPPRQRDYFGLHYKELKNATEKEQLDFMIYELKKGNEKDKLKFLEAAKNNYEGGSVASYKYFRPADKDGEAVSRGNRAAAYDASTIVAPVYERQDNGVNSENISGRGETSNSYDYRQFHIHGADTAKVKQIINEQMSGLTEQTMQDFKSPEK